MKKIKNENKTENNTSNTIQSLNKFSYPVIIVRLNKKSTKKKMHKTLISNEHKILYCFKNFNSNKKK